MHPRNRYLKDPADFGELAEFRPSLKPYLIEKRRGAHLPSPAPSSSAAKKSGFDYTLDFSDPAAVRELTCAVLERDFGLRLEIPLDRLVPTVPQKLNYLHWLEDLLACAAGGVASREEGVVCEDGIPKGQGVIGIDIGTGSSCIYPLLGSALNRWRFLATDIAMDTVQCACGNVSRNNMEEYVQVKLVAKESMLKDVLEPSVSRYSFSMCNPPFFSSEEDKLGALGGQRPLPPAFNTGSTEETITEGGEVGFVRRMISDSLETRDRVQWYTSMLGKRNSLKMLLSDLRRYQVPVVTSTEFVQGKTWRWGVAWSFDATLKEKVEAMKRRERKRGGVLRLLVKGTSDSLPRPSQEGVREVRKWLEEVFQELEVSSTPQSHDTSSESHDLDSGEVLLRCVAERVTWTHQRKKRRLLDRLRSHDQEKGDDECSLEETERKIRAEIDSLCVPCHIEFTTGIVLGPTMETGSPAKKKPRRKPVSGGEGVGDAVWLELDWIQGDKDKDLLHQLLQYLHNRASLKCFGQQK